MARSLRRDDRGVSTLWSFIGVVVLVAAILGVYYGYVVPKFAPPPLRAQSGDQVQVDYVGTFAENGLVFDTSVAAIAKDNASYPKAFMFAGHGEYAPLPVTVGSGGVVPGFDIGIQGLAIGDSKRIVVPPALGYGLADPTKIFVKPLLETVPVRLTMDTSSFVATYQTAAISGTNVTDPFWGWTATVSVAGTIVTVTNSPIPGQLVRPHGAWDAEVVSIDDAANAGEGAILVHHLLTPAMLGPVAWAGLLLAMAVAGDVLGTSLLYVAVRRWVVLRRRMPRWLERAMKKWTGFLLVQDERVILMNRAVPVIPMVGAFIATLGWDYRRSMAYVAIGGLAKYAILLYVVFAIGLAYDVATARWITLSLVVVVVGLSFVASWLRRRRIEASSAARP